jgi:acyl dehydratase
MSRPYALVRHQGPVLRTLGAAAITAFKQSAGVAAPGNAPALPGPTYRATLPPRPRELVEAYLRHVGGDPSAWRGHVPAHLFPQWTFPLAAKTLDGLPYPLLSVLNGGCRLEVNQLLPANEPLEVEARLEDIDDDGRRAVLHQRVVTGTRSAPDAVVAHLYAIVPLKKKSKDGAPPSEARKPKKEVERVPVDATELARWKLAPDAGLHFALLTGDFNPVHWVRPWAQAFGFRSTILHGFATMARAWEGLSRTRHAGAIDALRVLDVKFTRPLVLPAKVGLYTQGDHAWVADAAGGPAYLSARVETRRTN